MTGNYIPNSYKSITAYIKIYYCRETSRSCLVYRQKSTKKDKYIVYDNNMTVKEI